MSCHVTIIITCHVTIIIIICHVTVIITCHVTVIITCHVTHYELVTITCTHSQVVSLAPWL